MDLLSHLLSLVRLTGESLLISEKRERWELDCEAGAAAFHIVLDGEASLVLPGGEGVKLVQGDFLMLPLGRAHRLQGNSATKLFTARFRFEGDRLPFVNAELPPFIALPAVETRHEGWVQGLSQFILAETNTEKPCAYLMI